MGEKDLVPSCGAPLFLLLRRLENSRRKRNLPGRKEVKGGRYKNKNTKDSTRQATQALGDIVMLSSETWLLTVRNAGIEDEWEEGHGVAAICAASLFFFFLVCFSLSFFFLLLISLSGILVLP